MAPVILFNQTRCHRANNNISNNNSSDYSEYTVDTLLCPNSTEKNISFITSAKYMWTVLCYVAVKHGQ